MECPKCGGGGFLSEEELVKVLEERSFERNLRAILKATYQCRACSEKFSRLFIEDLARRKRPKETPPSQLGAVVAPQAASQQSDIPESIKFF